MSSKNTTTEMIFILDESGSMNSQKNEAINTFNDFIDEQKKVPGTAYFTLTLFNETARTPYVSIPIQNVSHLNRETYKPNCRTALYDAVGMTIAQWRNGQTENKISPPFVPKKMMIDEKTGEEIPIPESDVRYVLVILTDGLENASKEYHLDHIQKLMSDLQEIEGWKVIFLGAGFDVKKATKRMNIRPTISKEFCMNATELRASMKSASKSLMGMRSMSRKEYDSL